jgi:hypothetical protein
VLAPDVLVAATGTATVAPLLQATRTVFDRVRDLRWPRLSEQIFRIDKWSVCRG